jgi:hypothetical protein
MKSCHFLKVNYRGNFLHTRFNPNKHNSCAGFAIIAEYARIAMVG